MQKAEEVSAVWLCVHVSTNALYTHRDLKLNPGQLCSGAASGNRGIQHTIHKKNRNLKAQLVVLP